MSPMGLPWSSKGTIVRLLTSYMDGLPWVWLLGAGLFNKVICG